MRRLLCLVYPLTNAPCTDYMFKRRIFTVDPQYFPINRVRDIVSYLHSHDQQYGMDQHLDFGGHSLTPYFLVLMTDPAVGYLPGESYGPYDRGTAADIWLKAEDGSASLGLVWPGARRARFLDI